MERGITYYNACVKVRKKFVGIVSSLPPGGSKGGKSGHGLAASKKKKAFDRQVIKPACGI